MAQNIKTTDLFAELIKCDLVYTKTNDGTVSLGTDLNKCVDIKTGKKVSVELNTEIIELIRIQDNLFVYADFPK